MLLSGLDNIDFSGLGSMSGDMSSGDLYSTFRNALPPFAPGSLSTAYVDTGVKDSEIHQVIDSTLSKYEVKKLPIGPGISDSVTAFVKPIVINTVGLARAGLYQGIIFGILAQMSSSGLYLVPIGFAIPVKSELVDPNNIAAAGALAVGRSGSPSPSTPASSASPGSIADTIQSGIKSIMAAWPKSPPAGPTQYIRAPHTQTAAEKKRLMLIVGGFGIMFVLAIGVIAARNND